MSGPVAVLVFAWWFAFNSFVDGTMTRMGPYVYARSLPRTQSARHERPGRVPRSAGAMHHDEHRSLDRRGARTFMIRATRGVSEA